jgi:hypothetical protein
MRFTKKISKRTFLFGRTSGLSTALSAPFFLLREKISVQFIQTASSAAAGSFRFWFDVAVGFCSHQEQIKTVGTFLLKCYVTCGLTVFYLLKRFRAGGALQACSCSAILLMRSMFFVHDSNTRGVEEAKLTPAGRVVGRGSLILKKVACGVAISWSGKSRSLSRYRNCQSFAGLRLAGALAKNWHIEY